MSRFEQSAATDPNRNTQLEPLEIVCFEPRRPASVFGGIRPPRQLPRPRFDSAGTSTRSWRRILAITTAFAIVTISHLIAAGSGLSSGDASNDPDSDEELETKIATVGVSPARTVTSEGDGTAENPFQVPRTDIPITVDGLLDEPAWRDALVLELPYEFWPADNTPAAVRTEALLIYDDHAFYVAFRAYDPEPGKIQAHLSDRDEIWRDDQLGIEIDTFNDERRAYSIFINPLGVQEDAVEKLAGGFDFAWDAIWEAKTQFQPWGYSAEMKIPFSSIRFQRSDGPQVWGFNALRAWVRDKRYQLGAVPIDRDNNCSLCQLIKIEGFEGVSPGKNLEMIPTVTMAGVADRPDFPEGDLERQGEEIEAGLTTHWGMTPNLTVSGTINPDFSQVEADALQLDINERFALFYEEKRPFFSEGADFFDTRMDIVHTRTMHSPEWGLKAAGKEGTHTIGAYIVEDQVTNLVFPGSRGSRGTSIDSANTSVIGRYAKDVGSRITLGVLGTSRTGGEYSNRVAGADAQYRLSDSDVVYAQAMVSNTRYSDDVASEYDQPIGDFDGHALLLGYYRDTRNIGWWTRYEDFDTGFRADLGFVPQVGFRKAEAGARYTWWAEPGLWWSRLELGGEADWSEDSDGGLIRQENGVWFRYSGTLQTWVFAGVWQGTEGYAGQEFDISDSELSGSIRPVANLELRVNTRLGDRIDYRNARLGRRARIRPNINWKATRHLALDLTTTLERMDVDGERYYDASVSQATIAYQFSVHTFVRAILQYVDYDYVQNPTAKVVVPEDTRRFFTQLLFSYKLNPRSVLFIGYTENSLGDQQAELIEENRTLFAKVGYSFSL